MAAGRSDAARGAGRAAVHATSGHCGEYGVAVVAHCHIWEGHGFLRSFFSLVLVASAVDDAPGVA